MRNIRIILIIAVLILLSAEIVLAIPQFYLFKGTIRSIGGDNTAIAADQGFKVGQAVEYLVMVDPYVMGKMVYTNGEVDYDINGVYAELVSGTVLKEIDGGYYIDQNGTAIHKEFAIHLSKEIHLANVGKQDQKEIFIGNEDENVIIISSRDGIWNGYLHAYDSMGRKSSIHLDLELSAITSEIPYPFKKSSSTIPESAVMFIFGAGLLGTASILVRKKRQLKPNIAIPISLPEH